MYTTIIISLDGIEPKIWRKINVPSDYILNDLHHVIQIAMGWTNSHLYNFTIGRKEYTLTHYANELKKFHDSEKFKLYQIKQDTFKYLYDLGDYWEHTIKVVDRPLDINLDHAECIAGELRCPPEDVGGTRGFKEFSASMLDPDHPEREENITWFGKEFDFTSVDFRSINYRLKNIYDYIRDVEQ